MMSSDKINKVDGLLLKQKQLLDEIKTELDGIDEESLIAQNEDLKARLEKSIEENKKLSEKEKALTGDLEKTRSALLLKMSDEKLAAFKRVQKKIDAAYYTESDELENRLQTHKKQCLERISSMKKQVEGYEEECYGDIREKLSELETQIEERHSRAVEEKKKAQEALLNENTAMSQILENEELTEAEKRLAIRHKSIETFIGLNVLSKAGIVLLLIGIIALGRFAYTALPDLFKSLMIHGLGALLIAVGEFFNKKEKTIFSVALISGGVAVSYAAVATSFFALEIYPASVAFGLCAMITAVASALSYQLKSQVVCAFGAVGGYLPLVVTYAVGFGFAAANKSFLALSSVYFLILAAAVLFMTYNKKWQVAQFIGYAFQVAAVAGIAKCTVALKNVAGYENVLLLAVVFSALSFLIYMLMPSLKIFSGKNISISDTVLFSLNTLTGAVSVSLTLYYYLDWKNLSSSLCGAVFLVFAALYVAVLHLSKRNLNKTYDSIRIVLYVSAFVFSMLVIPFMFGWEYAAIAWAAEGAAIAAFAVQARSDIAERIGRFCVVIAFIFYIEMRYSEWAETYSMLMVVSFTVIVIAFWSYLVRAFSAPKETKQRQFFRIVYELAASVVTVFYLGYVYHAINRLPSVKYFSEFTDIAVYALSVCAVTAVLSLKLFRNRVSTIFTFICRLGVVVYTVLMLNCDCRYNMIFDFYGQQVDNLTIKIINLVLLMAVNVISAWLFARSASQLIVEFSLPVWIYSAAISISALALSTSLLIGQFEIAFSSVIISALYIAVSCILLFIGFKKSYTVVRTGGLVLILCALAKLCFVDTHSLDTAWKILSYFAFGAVLIVISYFYQRFVKKSEKEAVEAAVPSVSQDNESMSHLDE